MSRTETTLRTPIQKTALVVSAVFALVGIAGFVPGLTTDYDALELAGHESHAMLLGLFTVSVLHNIVHLAFGFVGFVMSRTVNGAYWYLVGGGVVYLLLFLYGLVIDHGSEANFVPLNVADNWLHLFLGVAMIGLGLVVNRRHTARGRR
ncbi:DUF4383 domain-containing protein [Lentzea sp. NPDC058450]|uniref:DUF4383 domain-containing protein n=1 Tax=Lentzea sp. NPDC058450 TaxID=3346505 RepID=UPI003651C891